jgi:hypothetical protein
MNLPSLSKGKEKGGGPLMNLGETNKAKPSRSKAETSWTVKSERN